MFWKPQAFKTGLFLVAVAVLTIAFLMVGTNEASAEDTINCRYKSGYGGDFSDVAFDDEYLYVAHVRGLSIFDISDPSEPYRIGFVHTSGVAQGVAVAGDYAYVADGSNGLVVFDVTNKADPQKVGGYDTSGYAWGVTVAYDYAYVADRANGLVVVNVADKTDPQKVGGYDTSGDAYGVTVAGDYAYVADYDNGLVVVDITDKTDPQKVEGYDTSSKALGVAVAGDYAYVADMGNGLVVFDVTNKTDPQKVGGYDTSGSAWGVTVAGDYAYVADSYNGLVVIDVTDKTDPQKIGGYDTSGYARGVAVAGDYAYVADMENGLVVFDVTNKTNPQTVGGYDTSGSAGGVVVVGDYAYVADSRTGLVVVDVTNKADPQKIANYDTSDEGGCDVAVAGDYAYVADFFNGFFVFDVTDKTDPQKVGRYDTSTRATGVAVAGDYAYVANGSNGLVVFDVTNKTDPQKVGDYNTSGYAYSVTVAGDYAYMAEGNEGLFVVDVTNKADPQKVANYDTSHWAFDVAVAGDYAYVADGDTGLVVVDVTDKTDPQKVGSYDTSGYALGVVVVGDYAYVADDDNGLVVVDVTDKTDPQKVGGYDTSASAYGVAVAGDYVYVADGSNGLVVVEMAPVARLDEISPSPALEGQEIEFVGEGTDDGTIERYVWRSTLDDEIYNGSSSSFATSSLSVGTHIIYFKAQDNYGVWSDEVFETLTIKDKTRASITSILPSPALDTNPVHFVGEGTDDGTIERYVWRSTLDDEIYNGSSSSFATSSLSVGTHTIYLKVQDNYGVWSDEVSETLIIHTKPTSEITSISPSPALEGQDIEFVGEGTDDGTIEQYVWRSSRDDEIYNGSSSSFTTSFLSNGTHTFYFKVQDNYGVWSDELSESLIIHTKPTSEITSISPSPALAGQETEFVGEGTDDGAITKYTWRSSRDDEIYNGSSSSFGTSSLSTGTHTIFFKVQDDHGVWSEEEQFSLVVTERPVAIIDPNTPDQVREGKTVTLSGYGTDDDTISRYVWRSSFDGEIHNGTTPNFTTDELSVGTHTIYFRVQDDHGVWSDEVSTILVVKEKEDLEKGEIVFFILILILFPLAFIGSAALLSRAKEKTNDSGSPEKEENLHQEGEKT